MTEENSLQAGYLERPETLARLGTIQPRPTGDTERLISKAEVTLDLAADQLALARRKAIPDVETAEAILELGRDLKTLHSDLEAARLAQVRPILALTEKLNGNYKTILNRLAEGMREVKDGGVAFQQKQRDLQAAEQRRLDQEARDRQKVLDDEAEANRKRLESERAAAVQEAKVAEDAGRPEQAEALRDYAEQLPSLVVAETYVPEVAPLAAAKVGGVGQLGKWKWNMTTETIAELVAYLIQQNRTEFLTINEKAIDSWVTQAGQGAVDEVAGIHVYFQEDLSLRKRR